VRAVAFRADGMLLATASFDGHIRLWRTPREVFPETSFGRIFKSLVSIPRKILPNQTAGLAVWWSDAPGASVPGASEVRCDGFGPAAV